MTWLLPHKETGGFLSVSNFKSPIPSMNWLNFLHLHLSFSIMLLFCLVGTGLNSWVLQQHCIIYINGLMVGIVLNKRVKFCLGSLEGLFLCCTLMPFGLFAQQGAQCFGVLCKFFKELFFFCLSFLHDSGYEQNIFYLSYRKRIKLQVYSNTFTLNCFLTNDHQR